MSAPVRRGSSPRRTPTGGRRWGWHRLTDPWAERVVAASPVRPGDLVLDLGAGDGALTALLVRAGARVIAVELQASRARRLEERFAGSPVTVVRTDLASLPLPARPYRVVANPPFGLSTDVLHRLLARDSRLLSADLVLQRSFVRQYVDGETGGARRLQRRFALRRGLALPRSAFLPPPRVDCGVLVVRRH